MIITHGTWGERVVIRDSDTCRETALYLAPNKRCSFHHHEHAFNLFFCIAGEVTIVTEQKSANVDGAEKTERFSTILGPKQSFESPPAIKHEFRTGAKGATVFEVAFVKYDPGDIRRHSVGGDLKPE